ncbi:MAG TPA: glutamine amidotransferase [Bryobacteraceae bacterium]|nr:glutamine amidotransferase [Bryobacteraceae bacterium]
MFELLFRYPLSAYAKGEWVFLARWPLWLLAAAILACAALLAWFWWRRQADAVSAVRGWRSAILWSLQAALVAALLLLLWQPALTLTSLKPQQNIVAVVVDDSRSMAIVENGKSRTETARAALEGGTLDALKAKFQTRIYRMSDVLDRVDDLKGLTMAGKSTHIGASLQQLAKESAGLPLGAVVLLSDGAENTGGLEVGALAELRSRRVPIHTIGIGKERPSLDVEIADVIAPSRALADSRISTQINLSSFGAVGRKVRLTVKDGGKALASKEVEIQGDARVQTENLTFNAGTAGARSFTISAEPLQGEENVLNNSVLRLVNVSGARPRVLYVEGEPRWEFKFIRRAVEDDKSIQLVTLLRTTQNKNYIQGVETTGDKELEQGFPATVDELFSYQAVVIGSVELNYFTTAQQELLKQFVDRRGGGLIMLAGRSALSEGGWPRSALAEMLPAALPDRKGTFHRDMLQVELTPAGVESPLCRLDEDSAKNAANWKKLPALMAWQELGPPKPGASVLAEIAGKRSPFVVVQNYGRGRTAIVAGDTWRWQMQQPVEDMTHEVFWRQMLRWAVSETPGRVISSTPRQVLVDDSRLKLSVDVRDRTFLPAADAKVEVRILGPSASGGIVELQADPVTPGQYAGEWTAEKPGQYVAEAVAKRGEEEAGRDVFTFERQDGIAENFHTQQNRELLEKLASTTGGKYWKADDLSKLPGEVSLSEAGITVRETKDLWNLPIVFLLLCLIKGSEWLLRRKWGVV